MAERITDTVNYDFLKSHFKYAGPLTTESLFPQGLAWRFDCGKPRRHYHLAFSSKTRCFRAGVKVTNGYGTTKRLKRPKRLADLFLSMLPQEELARAIAASLAR